jgi:NhaC family Na+:H+ antiporter
MLWDTIPAFILSLVIYWLISLKHVSQGITNMAEVNSLLTGLEGVFNLNPLLLILPLITIILAVRKVPAIPALLTVSFLGGLFSLIFQGTDIAGVLNHFTFGYKSTSGMSMLDNLLSKGGISSMGSTIILLITATALGGIMQKVGILDILLNKVLSLISSKKQLVVSSLLSSILVGFGTGAMALAIIIPGSMFASTFKKLGLHTKNLSRAIEAGGTVGITLVPWSVPAIFASSMLGAKPIEFIPLLFFPMLVIAFNLFYAISGLTITGLDKDITLDNVNLDSPSLKT